MMTMNNNTDNNSTITLKIKKSRDKRPMSLRFPVNRSLGILGNPDSKELWNEILDQIPNDFWTKKDLKILNVACGHGTEADLIVARMKQAGVSVPDIKNSIYLLDKYTMFVEVAKDRGYTNVIKEDFLEYEPDMKFDLVIGNPPFSVVTKKGKRGRGKDIYKDFYNKAQSVSNDAVCMIMPRTDKQICSSHNKVLRETANIIVPISPDYFNGIGIEMWYVVSLKSGNDLKPDNIDWLFIDENPSNNDIDFRKGKINGTAHKHLLVNKTKTTDNDCEIFHKVGKRVGGVESFFYDCSKVPQTALFPSSGFVVLMPQQITANGWTHVEVRQCNGKQAATNGVNLAFFENENNAKALVEYMKTKEFIEQATKYKVGTLGNMLLRSMKMISFPKDLFGEK